ncbi:MAG: cytochrome c [Oceanicola sp.]|nr:cytochrome c [Oceanicola sp.]
MSRKVGMAAAGLLFATAVMAGSHTTGNPIVDERNMVMKTMGKNLGILGAMAKGEVDYDASAAQAAADALLAAAETDPAKLWVAGTGRAEVPGSRAKAEIFADTETVQKISMDLVAASMAMQEAAGTGLDAVRANIGGIGRNCGACHKAYRLPKD